MSHSCNFDNSLLQKNLQSKVDLVKFLQSKVTNIDYSLILKEVGENSEARDILESTNFVLYDRNFDFDCNYQEKSIGILSYNHLTPGPKMYFIFEKSKIMLALKEFERII